MKPSFVFRFVISCLYSELLLPGHHPAGKILCIFKTHSIEHETSLAAAVAAATIYNDLFVFQVFDVVYLHGLNITKRYQLTTDIELSVFPWFTYIDKVNFFTGIHPAFQLINRNF